MLATTLNNGTNTVIEYGKADESIGVDVLVDWDVADEYNFWRLDWLSKEVHTY